MLTIKFAQILSLTFHAFNLSSDTIVGVFQGPKIKTQAWISSEYNDGSAEYLHRAVERRFGQQKSKICTLYQGSGLLWIVYFAPSLQVLKLQASPNGFPAHGLTSLSPSHWTRSVLALLFCHKTHLLPLILLDKNGSPLPRRNNKTVKMKRREKRRERRQSKPTLLFRFCVCFMHQMHMNFICFSFQSHLTLCQQHTSPLNQQVTSHHFSNINQSNQLSHHSKWHDLTLDVTLDATSDLTLDLTCRTRILNTNALVKISGSGSLIPN